MTTAPTQLLYNLSTTLDQIAHKLAKAKDASHIKTDATIPRLLASCTQWARELAPENTEKLLKKQRQTLREAEQKILDAKERLSDEYKNDPDRVQKSQQKLAQARAQLARARDARNAAEHKNWAAIVRKLLLEDMDIRSADDRIDIAMRSKSRAEREIERFENKHNILPTIPVEIVHLQQKFNSINTHGDFHEQRSEFLRLREDVLRVKKIVDDLL